MSLILTIFPYNMGILYRKMSLTQAQIIRLQKLTALKRDGDLDISGVLDSFDTLKDGKLTLPDMITRSGNGTLLPRPDIIVASRISRDDLLRNSHQRIAWHQIALTSIMIGE